MAHESWLYSYEALLHLHSLRLTLHASFSPPLHHCLHLTARLRPPLAFSTPSVICSWLTPTGGSVCVVVPLPLCLLDHSVPLQALAHADHIEIKLQLLICKDSLFGLSLERRIEDALELAEVGDALCCRSCFTRVTKVPFRKMQELPSVDWREIADNWFGNCCCSSSIKTEILLACFERHSAPWEGVCLVGQATCYVPRENILLQTLTDAQEMSLCNEETSCRVFNLNLEQETAKTQICESWLPSAHDNNILKSTAPVKSKPCFLQPDANVNVFDVCELKGEKFSKTHVPLQCKQSMGLRSEQMDIVCLHCEKSVVEEVSSVGASVESSLKLFLDHPCNSHKVEHDCLDGHDVRSQHMITGQNTNIYMRNRRLDYLDKIIQGPTGFTYSGKWQPFKCHSCSTLLGAYTRITNDRIEEGVHFYKRQILAITASGNLSDAFRKHTLQSDIAFELQSKSEVNSSYRFMLRGLNLKKPLLQLIIVNADSWLCVGRCEEVLDKFVTNHSILQQQSKGGSENFHSIICEAALGNLGHSEQQHQGHLKASDMLARFKPVMKVNFRDCRNFNEEELRKVEDWGKDCQADDIFLLEEEAPLLIEHLLENKIFCPPTFSIFKNFNASFLRK